jgi:hypothetical protein
MMVAQTSISMTTPFQSGTEMRLSGELPSVSGTYTFTPGEPCPWVIVPLPDARRGEIGQ